MALAWRIAILIETDMTQITTDELSEVDPLMADLLAREEHRQSTSIPLLAPTMLVSRSLMECLTSPLTNLDGEGYARPVGPLPAIRDL